MVRPPWAIHPQSGGTGGTGEATDRPPVSPSINAQDRLGGRITDVATGAATTALGLPPTRMAVVVLWATPFQTVTQETNEVSPQIPNS